MLVGRIRTGSGESAEGAANPADGAPAEDAVDTPPG
jgi:hypothetical protein